MRLSAACTVKKVPLAFTAKTRSHSWEVISSSGKVVMIPAHVTRPSTRPSSCSARSKHRLDVRQRRHVGAPVPDLVLELAGRGRQPIAVEIRQHHPRALSAGGVRDGTAHAGGSTGHDDDPIAKAQEV